MLCRSKDLEANEAHEDAHFLLEDHTRKPPAISGSTLMFVFSLCPKHSPKSQVKRCGDSSLGEMDIQGCGELGLGSHKI